MGAKAKIPPQILNLAKARKIVRISGSFFNRFNECLDLVVNLDLCLGCCCNQLVFLHWDHPSFTREIITDKSDNVTHNF